MKKFNKKIIVTVLAIAFVLGVAGLNVAHATTTATTPYLGAAASYGVLSDTYYNTSTTNTINGDVGFTTAPAATPGPLGQHPGITYPNYGNNLPPAYSNAGTAQATALSALNSGVNMTCDFTFPSGAIVLSTDMTHVTAGWGSGIGVYNPGKYCTAGAASAMSIGTGGISLNGSGTYIFKSDGALNTVTGSSVTLAGTPAASACDVFWNPNGATTLNHDSTFKGTVIPMLAAANDITVYTGVAWIGRALTFGHYVYTPGFDAAITVPTCTGANLNVVKVVNGPANPADFSIHVKNNTGGEVSGSPQNGVVSPGTPYALSAATYTVSETGGPSNYTTSFSGACDGSASVFLNAGTNVTCTITNTIIPYTFHVFKQVVGGTAIPSNFSLSVKLSGTDVTGSPQNGDSSGTSYTLLSNTTYVVSEVANASYTQSFSGDCDSSGSVTLDTDGKTCTITNTYHAPSSGGGGGGYIQPVFSPFINIISTPVVIAPIIPKLPKTGFAPQEKSTMLPIVILSGLSVFSIFLYFAQKKQTT